MDRFNTGMMFMLVLIWGVVIVFQVYNVDLNSDSIHWFFMCLLSSMAFGQLCGLVAERLG